MPSVLIDVVATVAVMLAAMLAGLTFYHIGWMRGYRTGRGGRADDD